MGFSTVLIVALAVGVVLVIGGGLMVYMGNLVRSAYEIKVQINAEVDERLTKMADDLDKKARWIKRDLLEEIEKIKVALHTDSARKIGELSTPLLKQLEALEAAIRGEHAETAKAIEADRQVIAGLDQRLRALQRQVDRGKAPPEPAPEATEALDEAAAIMAARAAVNAGQPAKPPEQQGSDTPPPAAAAEPGKPVPMVAALPDLGPTSGSPA